MGQMDSLALAHALDTVVVLPCLQMALQVCA